MIVSEQHDLYAVIGNPVAHSLSPAMMNAAFRAMRKPAVYLALRVEDPGPGLGLIESLGFRGISVTIPHKQSLLNHIDRVGAKARAIGAVNTLRFREGQREGHNTDWIGVVQALRKAGSGEPAGRPALVIGAGGAARAAVYGLLQEEARVTVTNRTAERGEALARDLGADFVPLDEVRGDSFHIAVQCTSAGMEGTGTGSPVPADFFHPEMTVLDAVYRPLDTQFLQAARNAGARTATGLDMLLHQGVAQLEWWLNRPAPARVMKEALKEAFEDEHND